MTDQTTGDPTAEVTLADIQAAREVLDRHHRLGPRWSCSRWLSNDAGGDVPPQAERTSSAPGPSRARGAYLPDLAAPPRPSGPNGVVAASGRQPRAGRRAGRASRPG